MKKNPIIALAGNPNCGKSTIFNALTGGNQHVGNWPGKTVEKKVGKLKLGDMEINVVDLPGTYSLSAYSIEEKIARDFIVQEKPDAVISVVDASNLERNLYLTLQLLEMNVPVIVVLNMMDVAEQKQLQFDDQRLSRSLESTVVRTIARDEVGIDHLKTELSKVLKYNASVKEPFGIDYGKEIEKEIQKLDNVLAEQAESDSVIPTRWLAIKLLEDDEDLTRQVSQYRKWGEIKVKLNESQDALQAKLGEVADTLTADQRYTWIHRLVMATVRQPDGQSISTSDKIDRIVTHRLFGIPFFLLLMWVVFKVTTDVAGPFLDWFDFVISTPITNWTVAVVGWLGLSGTWFESLLVDGVIAGVGGVLVFVPVLMALYLCLGILEDSGYMARAAFVMDRLMSLFGLHGKSFLPMVVGFGCTVPALYATRTLENENDRILTGLLVPFMSCGARLPVYVLFATIFFPDQAGTVIFSLYILGILVAVLLGILLKNTLFKGKENTPFIMELPPYRKPTFKSIWFQMWERTKSFVNKAWTIILASSVVIWFLLAIPVQGNGTFTNTEVADSAFAGASQLMVPALNPTGFGSWEAGGSLITGFIAKEVVVGTMAQVYDVEEVEEEAAQATTFWQDLGDVGTSFVGATIDTLKAVPGIFGISFGEGEEEEENLVLYQAVRENFETSSNGHGALASFGFMVFVLLYTPCMVAIAAEKQELGAKWMWVSIIGQLVIAWLAAVLVFQGGLLLGIG
ncbi:MAG: ferrous iron transport protein B [Anaerolineaceae bacterium]|nr:ferrous iron transport protein B [Anaerolineaceae bacterium]